MKLVFGFLFLCLSLFSGSTFAGSRAPIIAAHTMTCNQAIAFYQKYKRIYVVANYKDLVPIYGMKPISEMRNLVCTGRGQNKWGYRVKTLDQKSCVVAAYCQ
ncbi:MAG: hypothetical protein M9962_14390 [Oligoflexia bacterium]|nr:hypothetical protein [Oligoflexia bacterium]